MDRAQIVHCLALCLIPNKQWSNIPLYCFLHMRQPHLTSLEILVSRAVEEFVCHCTVSPYNVTSRILLSHIQGPSQCLHFMTLKPDIRPSWCRLKRARRHYN
ncbi:uncharacterized protein LOC143245159 [Tachypleus tridentatus]|uniref:uncharacterized protein LOC143245159 n=1 Tax=Tachypleus tridentatus TaxID=6853 RepID=UPI003FD222F8